MNNPILFPYAPTIYNPVGTGSLISTEIMTQTIQSSMGTLGTVIGTAQQLMGKAAEIPVIGGMVTSLIENRLSKLTTTMEAMNRFTSIIAQSSVQSAQLLQSLLYSNNILIQIQRQNQAFLSAALMMSPNLGGSSIVPQTIASIALSPVYTDLVQNFSTMQNLIYAFGGSPFEIQQFERIVMAPFGYLQMQNTLQALMRTGRIIPPRNIYGLLSNLIPITVSELTTSIELLQNMNIGRISPQDLIRNINVIALNLREIAQTLRTTTDAVSGLLSQLNQMGISIPQGMNFLSGLNIRQLGGNIMDLYNNLLLVGQLSQRMGIPTQFTMNIPLIAQMLFPFSPQMQQQIIQSTLMALSAVGGQYLSNFGGLSFIRGTPTDWIGLLTAGAREFGRLQFAAPMVNYLITRFGDITGMSQMALMPFRFYARYFGGEDDPMAQLESMIALGLPPEVALNTVVALQNQNITRLISRDTSNLIYDLINLQNRDFMEIMRDSLVSAGATTLTTRIVPFASSITGFLTSYLPLLYIARQIQREGLGFLRRFGINAERVIGVLGHITRQIAQRNNLPLMERVSSSLFNLGTLIREMRVLSPPGIFNFFRGIMQFQLPFMASEFSNVLTANMVQQMGGGPFAQIGQGLGTFASMLVPLFMNPFSLGGIALMMGIPFLTSMIGMGIDAILRSNQINLTVPGLTPLEMMRISDPLYLRRRSLSITDPTLKNLYTTMADIVERRQFSINDIINIQNTFSNPQFSYFLQVATRAIEKGDIQQGQRVIERYIAPTLMGILNTFNLEEMTPQERITFMRTALASFETNMRQMGVSREVLSKIREEIARTQEISASQINPNIDNIRKEIIDLALKNQITAERLKDIAQTYKVNLSYVLMEASKYVDFSKIERGEMVQIAKLSPETLRLNEEFRKSLERKIEETIKNLNLKNRQLRIQDVSVLETLIREGVISERQLGRPREDVLAEIELLRMTSSNLIDTSKMSGEQLIVEFSRQVNELAKIVENIKNKK